MAYSLLKSFVVTVALFLFASVSLVQAQDKDYIIVMLGSSGLISDFMKDAAYGALVGCTSTKEFGVSRDVATAGLTSYDGDLCYIDFYYLDSAEQGGTDTSCPRECMMENAVNSDADLIVGVGFGYARVMGAAADADPTREFAIVDSSYSPPKPNVEAFVWREDQSGFLAGVIAAEVAAKFGFTTVGGVGGIDYPAVKKFINGFVQGARITNPGLTIVETYSNSFGSQEEGFAHADAFLDAGVEVAFCAGGYTGSMACKKMSENGIFVIGVDLDEYYTTWESGEAEGSDFLLTSALKSTSKATQFAIECFQYDFAECAGRNNLLNAANGGIGIAPCHETCDVFDDEIARKVDDLFQDLADESLGTGVDPSSGDLLESNVIILSP